MKTQKDIFKSTEGDLWFNRNINSYKDMKIENDLIIQTLQRIEIIPKKILEIGCSNGSRLNALKKVFDSVCYGIDPSTKAIMSGMREFNDIHLQVGTADALSYDNNYFDTIIFGFCLYLCDRTDLFKIAFEADRCLSENGFIVILDFNPPFPYKNTYAHKKGILSYKMEYSKMFTWNPSYFIISNSNTNHGQNYKEDDPNNRITVTVLKKNERYAYPIEPFGKPIP